MEGGAGHIGNWAKVAPKSPSCTLACVRAPEWHYLCLPLQTAASSVHSNPVSLGRLKHLQFVNMLLHPISSETLLLTSCPTSWFHSASERLLCRISALTSTFKDQSPKTFTEFDSVSPVKDTKPWITPSSFGTAAAVRTPKWKEARKLSA